MDRETAQLWDARYSDQQNDTIPQPCYALREYAHLLPTAKEVSGLRALDLACGLGGNAIYLSQLGFETYAWDISQVAIDQLNRLTEKMGLRMRCEVRDVVAQPPQIDSMDIIVVSRFLHRELCAALQAALRHHGWVFYQTFSQHAQNGPRNPQYRLGENELLSLFPALSVRVFYDQGDAKAIHQKLSGESMLVAQRSQQKQNINIGI